VKFKVLKVREGVWGIAWVTVKFEDGTTYTFFMWPGEDIIRALKRGLALDRASEKRKREALEYAKQFVGKEFEVEVEE